MSSAVKMDKGVSYGSICLLCLRTKTFTSVKSDHEKHNRSRLACVQYIVLMSRHLNLDSELTRVCLDTFHNFSEEWNCAWMEVDLREDVNKFVLCDACLPLAESFYMLYRQFEVIRMKLHDTISEASELIERSSGEESKICGSKGRPPQKGGQLGAKETLDGGDKEKVGGNEEVEGGDSILSNFRTKLRTAGSNFRKSLSPKVCLKRHAKAEELAKSKSLRMYIERSTGPGDKKGSAPIYIRVIRQPGNSLKQIQPSPKSIGVLSPMSTCVQSPKSKPVPCSNIPASPMTPLINPVTDSPIEFRPVNDLQPGLTPPQTVPVPPPAPVVILSNAGSIASSVYNNNQYHQVQPLRKEFSVSTTGIQTCNIDNCNMSFPRTARSSFSMLLHLTTHTNMECAVCRIKVNSPMELALHELKHSTSDQPFGFKCSRCSCFSSFRTTYQEHFLSAHYNSSVEIAKCPYCKKGFGYDKQKLFESHLDTCHPSEKEDLSQCHECDICHVYFRKLGALWKHLKFDHKINNHDGSFKCCFCSESYFTSRFLELHKQFSCSAPEGIYCPDWSCTVPFQSMKLLRKHLSTHEPKLELPECPVCKIKLYDRYSMKYHVMGHNGEQVTLVFPPGNNQQVQQEVPVPILPVTTVPFQTDMNSYPMSSTSSSTPVIVSVSGASSDFVHAGPPHATTTPGAASTLDALEELSHFFDSTEDSNESEPCIILNQDLQKTEEDTPAEDPFAWILPDDLVFESV